MWSVSILPLLAACAHATSADGTSDLTYQSSVNPIQKVVQMLNEMLAKGQAEKHDEQITFATYKIFCAKTREQTKIGIGKGKKTIERLKAEIEEAEADVSRFARENADLDADMAAWATEREKKTAVRAREHADYSKLSNEYKANIDTIEEAILTVKASEAAMPTAFIELSSGRWGVSPSRMRRLMSFIQTTQPQAALLQGRARAKVTERADILEMVKELRDKMKDEKDEIDKAEMETAGNFDLMVGDLVRQIENNSRQLEKNAASKAQRERERSTAEGDLNDARATLAQDQKYLKDVASECETNSDDFEKRQQARAGEITAISKAIEIMSSEKVSGVASKHLPGLAQEEQEDQGEANEGATALVQLRSEVRGPVRGIVSGFLRERAIRSNSQILALLSQTVSSAPMKKIVRMIRDMVQKLMEEAAEEAEHKAFCDAEVGKNKFTRDKATEDSEDLTAEIEQLSADLAKLNEQTAALSEAIATIDATVAKASAERTAEKAKNAQTVAEAEAAQAGTAQALQVLRDFYEGASTAASLAQIRAAPSGAVDYRERAKAILDGEEQGAAMLQTGAPYTGMATGGVVGMLEVIESDFARLLSETMASEAEADKLFRKFSEESGTNKAVKSTDLKHKEKHKTETERRMQDAKKDLKNSNEQLEAALSYFEKLKPSCVDAEVSADDRVQRRKQEIDSLKEALATLEGQ